MEISDKYLNESKEEIYDGIKNSLISFYKKQLIIQNKIDSNSEYIDNLNKSIEHVDEAVIGTFGERKLQLYNLVSMLNDYYRKRLENKRIDIGFKNIMEKITDIFNGFGDKTKEICKKIEYTDNFNPDDAVKYYCELYGLNYIPHKEINNVFKDLLYDGKYEEFAKVRLEEGYLTKFSILQMTQEEVVKEEQNKRRI